MKKEEIKKGVSTKDVVTMAVIGSEKGSKKDFTIDQANQLLTMVNPSWKLADDKYKFNGTELIKK